VRKKVGNVGNVGRRVKRRHQLAVKTVSTAEGQLRLALIITNAVVFRVTNIPFISHRCHCFGLRLIPYSHFLSLLTAFPGDLLFYLEDVGSR
jgi:hypothetical protein